MKSTLFESLCPEVGDVSATLFTTDSLDIYIKRAIK
jgi:hypothetical protein